MVLIDRPLCNLPISVEGASFDKGIFIGEISADLSCKVLGLVREIMSA